MLNNRDLKIIRLVTEAYAECCWYCQLKGEFIIAQFNVSWSDREVTCCEEHLAAAKHAAANDGPDSDDNPYIEKLNQPSEKQIIARLLNNKIGL